MRWTVCEREQEEMEGEEVDKNIGTARGRLWQKGIGEAVYGSRGPERKEGRTQERSEGKSSAAYKYAAESYKTRSQRNADTEHNIQHTPNKHKYVRKGTSD